MEIVIGTKYGDHHVKSDSKPIMKMIFEMLVDLDIEGSGYLFSSKGESVKIEKISWIPKSPLNENKEKKEDKKAPF